MITIETVKVGKLLILFQCKALYYCMYTYMYVMLHCVYGRAYFLHAYVMHDGNVNCVI